MNHGRYPFGARDPSHASSELRLTMDPGAGSIALFVGAAGAPAEEKRSMRIEPVFLFDLDGTLVDSVYQHVLAWKQALDSEASSFRFGAFIARSA